MKTLFAVLISLVSIGSTQAQLFSREGFTGAAVGGILGGVIGHNSGRHTAEGVAIGAGAGLLLGSAIHEANEPTYYYSSYGYSYPSYPSYGYSDYSLGYDVYRRPNYALSGAALGALGGAIIGHNSGRHAGQGEAIGAGAGFILGSIAEQNARRRAAYYSVPVSQGYYQTSPTYAVPAPSEPAQSQESIGISYYNHSSSSSMSSANALFGR